MASLRLQMEIADIFLLQKQANCLMTQILTMFSVKYLGQQQKKAALQLVEIFYMKEWIIAAELFF